MERRRRKPTKSGVLLSGDLIVDCALRLVGQHGPDALSVRRLGAALGCDPSAVYRYFHNTDDLLLAVADRIIGESMVSFTRSDDWVADLRSMARRIHRAYSEHPRIAAMAAYRVTRRINEVKAVETGIGLLRSAGFDAATAVRYYAAFVDTALGHAALDASHLALPPSGAPRTTAPGRTPTSRSRLTRTPNSTPCASTCPSWRRAPSGRRWNCCSRRSRHRRRADPPSRGGSGRFGVELAAHPGLDLAHMGRRRGARRLRVAGDQCAVDTGVLAARALEGALLLVAAPHAGPERP